MASLERLGGCAQHGVLESSDHHGGRDDAELGQDAQQSVVADPASIGGLALGQSVRIQQQPIAGAQLSGEGREPTLLEADPQGIRALAVEFLDVSARAHDQRRGMPTVDPAQPMMPGIPGAQYRGQVTLRFEAANRLVCQPRGLLQSRATAPGGAQAPIANEESAAAELPLPVASAMTNHKPSALLA